MNLFLKRLQASDFINCIESDQLEASILIPYLNLTHYAGFFALIANNPRIELKFTATFSRPITNKADLENRLNHVMKVYESQLNERNSNVSGYVNGCIKSPNLQISIHIDNNKIQGSLFIQEFKNANSNTLKDILKAVTRETASLLNITYTNAAFHGKVNDPVEFKFR